MEGLILLLAVIAVAGWGLNTAADMRATPKGELGPRRKRAHDRAVTRAAKRGHRSWLSAPTDLMFKAWTDLFGHLGDRHDAVHADRFERWQARRDKRAATKAARVAARDTPAGRHAKGATPDTPTATAPDMPATTPKGGDPSSATSKPATPVAPPTQPSPTPSTGGPTMASANVPPSGEVNTVSAAKARVEEWGGFLKPIMSHAEQLQAAWAQQEKALLEGVVSAERTAACLLANGAAEDNPAVVAIRAARERLNQMATLTGEMMSNCRSFTQAGQSVGSQFDVMQTEVDIWMSARQHVTQGMPGVTAFMTQGG